MTIGGKRALFVDVLMSARAARSARRGAGASRPHYLDRPSRHSVGVHGGLPRFDDGVGYRRHGYLGPRYTGLQHQRSCAHEQMKSDAIVGNIVHFDKEIQMAEPEGSRASRL